MREGETDRQRQTETENEGKRDTETKTKIDRQTRQRDRQRNRQTDRDRQRNRQTETDRQDRQTEKQTGRRRRERGRDSCRASEGPIGGGRFKIGDLSCLLGIAICVIFLMVMRRGVYPERPSRDLTIMPSEVDIEYDARVRETSLAAVTEVPLLSGRTVKRLCNFHSKKKTNKYKICT